MPAIILIGYRGVGKSTVTAKITEIWTRQSNVSVRNLSLDTALSEKIGDLQAFIRKNGWEAFRHEETALVRNLVLPDGKWVIDCGGGIVEQKENMLLLKRLGKIVYLKASVETLQKRLLTTHMRLSLSSRENFLEEIRSILEHRDPLYSSWADYCIESDWLSVQECSEKIIKFIESFEFKEKVE